MRQRKLSFGVKIVQSGFTKDAQWQISAEKSWTQLCLRLSLLNMHIQFPFHPFTQKLEYSNESRNTFALIKLLAFAPLFNTPKKHVLNYFALEMAIIIIVEGRGFFPHVSIYFECQKNTLSKHIVCQAMLFLICLGK